MFDNVEWLRNSNSDEWCRGQLLKVADEIERLRERLAEADECNRRVSDENERLKREAVIHLDLLYREQEAHLKCIADFNKHAELNGRLFTENAELRQALTSIFKDVCYHNPMRMTTEISDKVLFEAKAALNEKIL